MRDRCGGDGDACGGDRDAWMADNSASRHVVLSREATAGGDGAILRLTGRAGRAAEAVDGPSEERFGLHGAIDHLQFEDCINFSASNLDLP